MAAIGKFAKYKNSSTDFDKNKIVYIDVGPVMFFWRVSRYINSLPIESKNVLSPVLKKNSWKYGT